jgi:predicted RecB family nuclease
MAGWQCLKRLYLRVHEPELAAETDEATQAIIDQGAEVGRLAREMFPGGALIEAHHFELDKAIAQTSKLVAESKVPAIFEATFSHADALVRVDILQRLPKGNKWKLIEVKSTTSVKTHHSPEVAIQRFVLEGLGFQVVPCLMHLNRDYVYDGRRYELEKLFAIEDLTKEIDALRKDLPALIREQLEMLGKEEAPEVEPGAQCEAPIRCEFFDVCNKPLPYDHVTMLPRMSATKLASLRELGVTSIRDIPSGFSLTEAQKRACQCVRSGEPWFGKGLKKALIELEYPLYFMDFETLGLAIPRFAGMRPYDPIPFQWSVHVQKKPGRELERYEFLARDDSDPRPTFLKQLCEVLGKKGKIVVYNQGFESGVLGNLAEWVPGYESAVKNIQGRLWDLLPVIRSQTYHAKFQGSYSLKSILPALVPGMTYEGMDVAGGEQAGVVWETMIHGQLDEKEKKEAREALLAYCRQDTLAMAKLLQVLREHAA